MIVKRYLEAHIKKDLKRKMVFLGGARQVGKTSLAENLLGKDHLNRYLNWDNNEDRENILKGNLPLGPGIVVLDEVHKYKRWRQLVKGLYDKRKREIQVLITGSARLDYYRHGGDSLQGRYHYYRLHPFSLSEIGEKMTDLERLLRHGPFPEPYLQKNEKETRRWSREYRVRIIRDELRDLERVTEIGQIEKLSLRLPELVGSPLSINSLKEDLLVSHKTVSRWVSILERLYFIFRIYPFGSSRLRAVKKEAKHYHFDWTQIQAQGIRFENLVACHLLKWCNFLEDSEGRDMELRYFRDVDLHEVDFVLMESGKPTVFIECKLSKNEAGKGMRYLHSKFPDVTALQISLEEGKGFVDRHGIRHMPASDFLKTLV